MKSAKRFSFRALWLAMAAMSVLPACQREMDQPDADGQAPMGPVSVAVTIDQKETRATVSEASGAIAFSKGDIIKIYDGAGIFMGVTNATTASGMFFMEEGFNAHGSGFAGFPAHLVSDITSEGVSFTLPDTYDFSEVGGDDADLAFVPCPMVGDFTGHGGVSLKPACAVIRFYVSDIKAGSLVFSFPTLVTGKTVAIATPSGTNDGIIGHAAYLSEASQTITVTGVPDVAAGRSVCITLPVPTGTAFQHIRIVNKPADDSVVRVAVITGSGATLARSAGHKVMDIPFKDFAPEDVDLGLSVKWANMNVGALIETDYGDYFAWGETEPKSSYEWLNYKWCKGSYNSLTKYCQIPDYGYHRFTDDRVNLDLSDDAAYVNWGEKWRMPTTEEMEELLALPNEIVEDYNGMGVSGLKITAPNGNSIFLPAAGARGETYCFYEGVEGYYWLSDVDGSREASYCYFATDIGQIVTTFDERYPGLSVRPVLRGDAPAGTLSSVEISPASLELSPGETRQLSAIAKDAQGNTISDADIFWTVERGLSAAVSSSGLVRTTAGSYGLTIVRATAHYGGTIVYADCPVRVNNATAVDLGLSVLWADRNVGARDAFEYGDYFAWGEVFEKSEYNWSSYKWGNEYGMTKYNSTDGKTVLDLADDAAHYHWGGNWRMPTYSELLELWATKSNTTDYEWTWDNTKKGWKIKSLKAATYGNSIFIPCAGIIVGPETFYLQGTIGYYWSSSVRMDDDAWFFTFYSSDPGFQAYRCYGASVRPVRQ